VRIALLHRFIFAFGGAGLFTFVTAAAGLAGVSWNSRALLGVYSVLLVLMLLAQAVVAVALFTDNSWKRYLPPDETGEVKKVLPPPVALSVFLAAPLASRSHAGSLPLHLCCPCSTDCLACVLVQFCGGMFSVQFCQAGGLPSVRT
jgi:Na+-transporting methylmalonyl-CoA/oxaloacetate decarboxylase gamma subunit